MTDDVDINLPLPEGIVSSVDHVKWVMPWSVYKDEEGNRKYPDKEDTFEFEDEKALALLLLNDVVFLNNNWWRKDWPKDAKKMISINVNCNDVFAWGCADAEGINYSDLEDLWDHFEKDPISGPTIWCIKKRKEMPQRPVEKKIREAGIWDLDKIKEECKLENNHYDTRSKLISDKQYKLYCDWEISRGKTPRIKDIYWWDGWREYTKEHPEWHVGFYETL
jgi:hypothetical protein